MKEAPFHPHQEPTLISTEKTETGQLRQRSIDDANAEAFLNYWHNARDRILETIPSQEAGIDMERAQSFFAKKGLATRPHILLSPDYVPSLQEILTDSGITTAGAFDTDRFAGEYLGQLGVGYVIRDPELEAKYGPAYTEALLVHEMAHSSGIYNLITIEKTNGTAVGYEVPRVGQKMVGQGSFNEEAFASLVETEYIQNELHMPNGFANIEGLVELEDGPALPGKYLIGNEEEGYSHGNCAYAAYGMELLNAKDPGIIPALYKARNSVEGLREIAYRINALSPGLYKQLRELRYTVADMQDGLALIQQKVVGA